MVALRPAAQRPEPPPRRPQGVDPGAVALSRLAPRPAARQSQSRRDAPARRAPMPGPRRPAPRPRPPERRIGRASGCASRKPHGAADRSDGPAKIRSVQAHPPSDGSRPPTISVVVCAFTAERLDALGEAARLDRRPDGTSDRDDPGDRQQPRAPGGERAEMARGPGRRQSRETGVVRGPQHRRRRGLRRGRRLPRRRRRRGPRLAAASRRGLCRPGRRRDGGDRSTSLARGQAGLVPARVRLGGRMHPLGDAERALAGEEPGRRQHVVSARGAARRSAGSARTWAGSGRCRSAARRPTSASGSASAAPRRRSSTTRRRRSTTRSLRPAAGVRYFLERCSAEGHSKAILTGDGRRPGRPRLRAHLHPAHPPARFPARSSRRGRRGPRRPRARRVHRSRARDDDRELSPDPGRGPGADRRRLGGVATDPDGDAPQPARARWGRAARDRGQQADTRRRRRRRGALRGPGGPRRRHRATRGRPDHDGPSLAAQS